jgi:DNA-binding NarL/FixJ family response regulator
LPSHDGCDAPGERLFSALVPRQRRSRLCLLSSHPLVLGEYERLLAPAGFQVQSRLLESKAELRVPRASLYVIDAHPSRQMAEVVVARVAARAPGARLVVVAQKFTEANSFPLLRRGAKGLLTYPEAREHLASALQTVSQGGFWVPRRLLSRFVDSVLTLIYNRKSPQGPADLSRREREVLDALLENLANKEIASRLNIAERTAKFHVSHLLAKFGVRRRADLILLHFQNLPARA